MSELAPHVEVRGLTVTARNAAGEIFPIVSDIDFTLKRGEVLALIGESGSGKTTIALTLLGHARPGARIAGGSIHVGDVDLTKLDRSALAQLRGNRIAYIAQSAAAAFNPSRTIMEQVIEPALIHDLMPRSEAEAKAVELFRGLALPFPDTIGSRYPHQLSGGQLQRLMAAMALITDPELVILDEPTTALDVTTQIEVLRAFKAVVLERGATAIYVSHDLAVVAQMADQIVVLSQGRIQEAGAAAQILHAPADEYTKTLMAAARPAIRPAPPKAALPAAPLLEIKGLTAGYGKIDKEGRPRIPVLRDINLTIERGATLGVIGESGSGKSTIARVIAGLLPPASGQVLLDGEILPPGLKGRSREQFRRVQLVFQNADTALNPAHSVGRILARPLAFYHGLKGNAAHLRVLELLDLIRLPATLIDRPIGGLSGGQKQRINLARALAADPQLILCDEVTSALDTVVGAAILELMAELRRELGIATMFISHDISTVRAICDDILVLYSGTMVETGPRAAFGTAPFHPYTDLLIGSVPEMRAGWLEESHAGAAPPPIGASSDHPDLCRFLPRCAARVDGLCNTTPPPRQMLAKGSQILCHHGDESLIPS
ncbi:peptide/nickel transport system ATP-binding protein [Sphingobium xenophagum]|uniref:Peptide/nickel transport system ATP-binding protein n=1 Tax=Sphingobium xenophagum TaxID=121428 RepID=A0ABU1X3U7_SPHXE|nr:ABC transporter ATP-binding protein [Sphingobium xenophagum]MDR7156223.1 peptide/nickel transport system ATP-binding protein [Sphingobium xenophagum]